MLLGRRLLGARQLDSALQLPVGSSVSQIQCCGVVGYQIRQVPLRSLSAATVTTAGNAGSTTLCFGGCPPPVTKLQLRSLSSSSSTSFPSPSPLNNQVPCYRRIVNFEKGWILPENCLLAPTGCHKSQMSMRLNLSSERTSGVSFFILVLFDILNSV